jgi:wobble nucleotide-excising tRNase
MNDMKQIANQIAKLKENIVLIYAFNGTGKTRLSVFYKDITKAANKGVHAGVYYNAYSEDLFVWDNDDEHDGADVKLKILSSSLNQYHQSLDEEKLREHLKAYKPKFDFKFQTYENVADGIEYVQFFLKEKEARERGIPQRNSNLSDNPIKISRGEQQFFIWCFFLTLFDVEGWTGDGKQSSHFFIDDPVSSFDEHNIFVTASSLMDLIDRHFKQRKIVITTHHIGLFSILCDWIGKGEKKDAYKNRVKQYILKKSDAGVELHSPKNDVFLYHLELLQVLKQAIENDELYAYHFALLRQVLENIASFLGVGRFAYVLEQIGLTDTDEIARIVNTLSHKTVFRYEAKELVPDNKALFKEIFEGIMTKYNFVLHI